MPSNRLLIVEKLLTDGHREQARLALADVLDHYPDDSNAINLLSRIDIEDGEFAIAEDRLRKLLERVPDNASASFNLGVCYMQSGRLVEALELFRQSSSLDPTLAAAQLNQAFLLRRLGRIAEACDQLEKLVAQNPKWIPAQQAYCEALLLNGEPLKASEICSSAIRSGIAIGPLFKLQGDALRQLNRFDEARISYAKALKYDPDDIDALLNLAGTLQLLGQAEAAIPVYEELLVKSGDARGAHIFDIGLSELVKSCRRTGALDRLKIFEDQARLRLQSGISTLLNDVAITICDEPVLLKRNAENSTEVIEMQAPRSPAPLDGEIAGIRIGIISDNFLQNQSTNVLADVVAELRQRGYEVFGYSIGDFAASPVRHKFKLSLSRFADLAAHSDEDAARQIAADKINILINATRGSVNSRLGIVFRHPAELVASFHSFPGTLGSARIDYLIADQTLVGAEDLGHHVEAVATLNGSFNGLSAFDQANPPIKSRLDYGLPESKFVFCAPTPLEHVSFDMLETLMSILREAPASVLWLNEPLLSTRTKLRALAERFSVLGDRLIFMAGVPYQEHLERLKHADLILCNVPGDTSETAEEAMLGCVPAIAKRGQSFASRTASSVLAAAGLTDFVVSGAEDYVEMAVRLSASPALLEAARSKLARERSVSRLFDAKNLARQLGQALDMMLKRHREGLPPHSFQVAER